MKGASFGFTFSKAEWMGCDSMLEAIELRDKGFLVPGGVFPPLGQTNGISGKNVSVKASNKRCVVLDHPRQLRPHIFFGQNRVKVVFNRRRSFHGDPLFLFGERLVSDRFPEACTCEQVPDSVASALQPADKVGCGPV
jgi:hypothetical protein